MGHSGEDLILPSLLVLVREQSGKGAVVEYNIPPQHIIAVLPHDVHLPRGKRRVGQGLLLQLDASVQLFKKRVRELLRDLFQPVPHGLVAGHHGKFLLFFLFLRIPKTMLPYKGQKTFEKT